MSIDPYSRIELLVKIQIELSKGKTVKLKEDPETREIKMEVLNE